MSFALPSLDVRGLSIRLSQHPCMAAMTATPIAMAKRPPKSSTWISDVSLRVHMCRRVYHSDLELVTKKELVTLLVLVLICLILGACMYVCLCVYASKLPQDSQYGHHFTAQADILESLMADVRLHAFY
jgi:hypothetical protein